MFKQILASAIVLASVATASAAHAYMPNGTDYYGNQGYRYSTPRPDPNAYAQAGYSVGGYSPYGYGYAAPCTGVTVTGGAKLECTNSLFGGTKLGVNKSCEKVDGGTVCTKTDGSQVLISKVNGKTTVTPM